MPRRCVLGGSGGELRVLEGRQRPVQFGEAGLQPAAVVVVGDGAALPVAVALDLIASLHARWIAIYGGMDEAQFSRAFVHPEYPDPQTLDRQAQLYSWHSRHHVAHIAGLRQREGW